MSHPATRANGILGAAERDLRLDLAQHDQSAKTTELALRADIARLSRLVASLRLDLALSDGRTREPLPPGSTRPARTPTPAQPFALPGFPHGLKSQRRRPA